MTPEEHYICALSALSIPETEQREFVADFRRSLIEHDTRVIEDFLYGSEDAETSTCSGCGEEYPTDELYDEFSDDGDAMFVVCQHCSTAEGMKRPRVEDR